MPATKKTTRYSRTADRAREAATDSAKKKSAKTAARKKAAALKPKLIFFPGSLNDQLSKLEVGESYARCKRITFLSSSRDSMQRESQDYFKQQNSILSGSISKVRAVAEHKPKRFTMERGQYASATNDAMFFFITITRTE